MKLSRPARDRLIALGAVLAVIIIAFSVVLIAKSTPKYIVTFYSGETIVKTERIKKGERATAVIPDAPQNMQFDCWLTKEGVEFDFFSPITDDIDLFAKFI